MRVKTYYSSKDVLGEGPVWDEQEQSLYWIDIVGKKLQCWQPETKLYKEWHLPSAIGSYALRDNHTTKSAIVALKTGIYFLNLESGGLEPLTDPEEHLADNRFNDGKCDRQGRFWAGTMDTKESGDSTGALYRIDQHGDCRKMLCGIGISNGLGWSPDNKTMYYTDSPRQTIYAFNFDEASGNICNQRTFATITDGFPDGLTVDSEGGIWSAVWDGWCINHYAPTGELLETIEMPVQRPTSCVFGGKNLDELYITSASIKLSEAELSKQPDAGNVFTIKTQVQGKPEPKFAG